MDFSSGFADKVFSTLTFVSQRSISRALIRKIEKRKEKINPDEEKYVALTFDDGPCEYTNRLLDILKENDSRATFFLAGDKLGAYKDVVTRYKREGHGVGNHLYSHTPLPKMSNAAINDEIAKTDSIFEEISGETIDFIRAPHGLYTEESRKAESLMERPLIGWNVDSFDFIFQMKEIIEHRLLNKINNDSIVLMHDVFEGTVDAIESCLPKLIKQGFSFVDLHTLFSQRDKALLKNHIYKSVYDFEVVNQEAQ